MQTQLHVAIQDLENGMLPIEMRSIISNNNDETSLQNAKNKKL